jgi:hypothetical protein
MMVAPSQASGIAVVDLLAQTTRLWGQVLLAPLAWAAPPAPSLAVAPPRPAPPAVAPDVERLTSLASADAPITDHALLVVLGQFAQHLGLLTLLKAVPIDQKKVQHAPQDKLIEFLVAILAGVQPECVNTPETVRLGDQGASTTVTTGLCASPGPA